MKTLKVFLLVLFILVVYHGRVSAFDEQIGDIGVPYEVSMAVQDMWQGYIIYSVRAQNGGYTAVIARDGEPHQFPVRYVYFDNKWKIVRDTGYQKIVPPKIEPKPEVKPEPKPEEPKPEPKPEIPNPVMPEIPKPPKPQKPEDPPVKPPEEEPMPEEPPVDPVSA